jgi:signal transduction histidine kinase
MASLESRPEAGSTSRELVALLERVGAEVVASALTAHPEGIAVLDGERRFLWVNEGGAAILGAAPSALLGASATMLVASGVESPGRDGAPELELVESPFGTADDRWTLVTFRDVTIAHRRQRQLRAFTRAAARVTVGETLDDVLDHLAEEVQATTEAVACGVVLVDPDTGAIQAGAAGDLPPHYAERLEESRALGAPLLSLKAFETGEPQVGRHWMRTIRTDPRFAPILGDGDHDWDTIVVAPIKARGRQLGVLTASYAPGVEPDDEDVAFLSAIGDQAAVAIENARLVAQIGESASLEERHRLARDLHDSISQAMFSLTLHTRAVQLAHSQHPPDRESVAQGIAELRELTQGVHAEMRALIFQLRPGALHDEGLVAAVTKQAAAVAARSGLAIEVAGPDERLPLPEAVEEELFRLVQEALNNVVKHAGAHQVRIEFRTTDGELTIRVADDGVGFDPGTPYPGHLGLTSMAERAARAGGRLRVDSRPSGPTVVEVLLPVAAS